MVSVRGYDARTNALGFAFGTCVQYTPYTVRTAVNGRTINVAVLLRCYYCLGSWWTWSALEPIVVRRQHPVYA